MRLLVSSLVSCLLTTGARAQWYGGYAYPPSSNVSVTVVYPPPAQPPTVVVLESERPVPVPVQRQEEYGPVRQVTYLIAFKNNEIRAVDQYWVKGKTLYYLTADHQRRTAPIESVNRALSKRLNREQNVAFVLPAAEGRAVRHTTTFVRKRCYWAPISSASVSQRRAQLSVRTPAGNIVTPVFGTHVSKRYSIANVVSVGR
jgi:hypothetical protein